MQQGLTFGNALVLIRLSLSLQLHVLPSMMSHEASSLFSIYTDLPPISACLNLKSVKSCSAFQTNFGFT